MFQAVFVVHRVIRVVVVFVVWEKLAGVDCRGREWIFGPDSEHVFVDDFRSAKSLSIFVILETGFQGNCRPDGELAFVSVEDASNGNERLLFPEKKSVVVVADQVDFDFDLGRASRAEAG